MIKITNIKKAVRSADENWAIVRSLRNKTDWIKQVTALSPSTDLFYRYLRLRNAGKWNKNSFQEIYVPQFLRELRANEEAEKMLQYLCEQDKLGKTIVLVCFCTDESECHRSIIAGILSGMGCNVVTDTGKTYDHYYEMFQK